MRRIVGNFSVVLGVCAVVCLPTGTAAAQLPPEIMVDKHLIHADQLNAARDFSAAFDVMQQIIALQRAHDLTLPDEFHFKYAQVALAADSNRIALQSVSQYLAVAGKEGRFYKEALALLLKAEGVEVVSDEDFYNDVIKAQGTCAGLPAGSRCWMALTNHPDCYVWNDYARPGQSALWSGGCSGHVASGKGTLTWKNIGKFRDQHGEVKQREYTVSDGTGNLRRGKKEGKWVHEREFKDGRLAYEKVTPYLKGRCHGAGFYFWYNDRGRQTVELTELFANGEVVGRPRFPASRNRCEPADSWLHTPDAARWASVEHQGPDEQGNGRLVYRNGDIVWGGAYVKGKRHGEWIERFIESRDPHHTDECWGSDLEGRGSFVHGKKEGRWVWRDSNGNEIGYGTFVRGNRHGEWVCRDVNGNVLRQGRFVQNEKHGRWIDQIPKYDYRDIDLNKRFGAGFVGEGRYTQGNPTGQWVYRHPNGDVLRIGYSTEFANLIYIQNPWFWYDFDEKKCWRFWRNDDGKEKKKKVKEKHCLESNR